MERGYKVTRDDPMPKPDVLLENLKQFHLVTFTDAGVGQHGYGCHLAKFSLDTKEFRISTEMRSNGLLYNVGSTSVICTTDFSPSDETQWKRFFTMALTRFSKYPEIEIELTENRWSNIDQILQSLRDGKRKSYFKSTFWKSGNWEMPEELKPLYEQFHAWAYSIRTRIKKHKFEKAVEHCKYSLANICGEFSRDELIQIVDEVLTEQLLGA